MSKTLSSVAVTEFDTLVKQAYQDEGKLRMCVTNRTGVFGTYDFRKMGKGLANQKASQADVVPMDVSHSLVPAIITNWNAPEYTDIFDQANVNFDEKSELARAIAKAISRREDQMIIDSMNTLHANSGSYAGTVAVGAANLSVDKLIEASGFMNAQGVDDDGRYIAVTAGALEGLLKDTKATSSDFNTVKALVQGDIDTFVGFKFIKIASRDEGGLPGTASDRTCFAWHQQAVGHATSLGPRTEINYIAQKTAWLCNGVLGAGSVAIEAEGIVPIHVDETA